MKKPPSRYYGMIAHLFLLWVIPIVITPLIALQDKLMHDRFEYELRELTDTAVFLIHHWTDRPVTLIDSSECSQLAPGFLNYSKDTTTHFFDEITNYRSINVYSRKMLDLKTEINFTESTPLQVRETFLLDIRLRNKFANLFMTNLKNIHVIDSNIDSNNNLNFPFAYRGVEFILEKNNNLIEIKSERSNIVNSNINVQNKGLMELGMSHIRVNNEIVHGEKSVAKTNPCGIP